MRLTAILILYGALGLSAAEKVETVRLNPAPNMTRADLKYVDIVFAPKAVLVLCPGVNGDGAELLLSARWVAFAKENNLGLVGLSFGSSMSAVNDGTGYYYVSRGSGEKLLEGLRKIYGRDLPLILCGFSGGAHFTSRFVEWKPECVVAWCAYSAGWWDEPVRSSVNPPGIVACGDEDTRYGASLIYFKQGRATGKPWLWVSVPKTGHSGSAKLDDFVRSYFTAVLSDGASDGAYLDIDRKTVVEAAEAADQPSLTAWLPSRGLFEKWKEIHGP